MTRIYIEKICDLGFSKVANSQSAAGKALLRSALERDHGINGELVFTYGNNGKPYLDFPAAPWFNISHSGEYVACIISDECEVGLDIQRIVPARMRVAARVFTSKQCEELAALDEYERDVRFCELWVLREAAIKARGGSVMERTVTDDVINARLIAAPYGYRAAIAERIS